MSTARNVMILAFGAYADLPADFSIKKAAALTDAALAALAAAGLQVVPVEPTLGKLASMALRFDHGLFMPVMSNPWGGPKTEEERANRIQGTIRSMRQLHEEVVLCGFYSVEAEDRYAAMLTASPSALPAPPALPTQGEGG